MKAIFDQARTLSGENRMLFLAEACRGRAGLQSEVEELLRSYNKAEGFFDGLTEKILHSDGQTDDLIGRRVGSYDILDRLGEGGMGVVYKARHRTLNQFAALKFLNPNLLSVDGAKDHLVEEARAAYALDHPNICTIYDVGETDDRQVFISMAYYEGETLRERLRRTPLTEAESVEIAVQICRGLARAHAARIVHGDVKPSNIFLTSEGVAKILDFGVAVTLGMSAPQPVSKRGTIAYMSPEQIRGGPVDTRSDIWSLGLILHEMLTGEHPFRGPDDGHPAVAYAITSNPWRGRDPKSSQLEVGMTAIVDRCLMKAPEDRYLDVGDLLRDLQRVTETQSRSPSPDSGRTAEGAPNEPDRLYVTRDADRRLLAAISEPGVTVTVKGAYQMGKSSLLCRVIEHASEAESQAIVVNFQSFDRAAMGASDRFFQHFTLTLSESAGVVNLVDEYWSRPGANPHRCSRYVSRHVLRSIGKELILCLDEVELLFDAPFRVDFFGMLRSWHNERATSPLWRKLSIVLSTSTEPYDLLQSPNLSPFNVGQTIELAEFDAGEVAALNERCGGLLAARQVEQLTEFVNGHPYLIKTALNGMATGRYTFADIMDQSTDRTGPFGDHLNYHLFQLGRKPEMLAGLSDILDERSCDRPEVIADLLGAGLIRRDDGGVTVRSPLYDSFFRRHLRG